MRLPPSSGRLASTALLACGARLACAAGFARTARLTGIASLASPAGTAALAGALLCTALLAWPAAAAAHGEVPIRFDAPVGVGNDLQRGEPLVVRWRDPDVGEGTLTLYATQVAPPPRVASWPLDDLPGTPIFGPVPLADPANEAVIDTSDLEPGTWFFWLGLLESDRHTQYVPPAGVVTLTAPGSVPPPTVFFAAPARNETAVGGFFELEWSTWPGDAIAVEIRALPAGESHLTHPARWIGEAGADRRLEIDLRCVVPNGGWVDVHGKVIHASDRTGEAWATGQILVPAGLEPAPAACLPADPPPDPVCDDASACGGACDNAGCNAGTNGSPLLALLGLALHALSCRLGLFERC